MGVLWAGCFYVDPIETHPTVTLSPPNTVPVARGARLIVTAALDRPGTFDWSAKACADRDGIATCGPSFYVPIAGVPANTAYLDVPVRVAVEGSPLTQRIEVRVEARDDRGALAFDGGTVPYTVEDSPPVLELTRSAHSYTVGAPISVYATYSDLDDELADITLQAAVVTPSDAPAPERVEQSDVDATHVTVTQRFVPSSPGSWVVKVTATDKQGMFQEKLLAIDIGPDQPPCIAQARPVVPPAGATLPIIEPTLFQIPLVDDDLDAYPPVSGDPLYGTASFAWSILKPGAPARVPLPGASGNRAAFDPRAYTPGQIVELRVEAFDRHHTEVTCPDDVASCALDARDGCFQRQTWRVEIR